jgi:hypothetical protein
MHELELVLRDNRGGRQKATKAVLTGYDLLQPGTRVRPNNIQNIEYNSRVANRE